jgi:hypothetical protein
MLPIRFPVFKIYSFSQVHVARGRSRGTYERPWCDSTDSKHVSVGNLTTPGKSLVTLGFDICERLLALTMIQVIPFRETSSAFSCACEIMLSNATKLITGAPPQRQQLSEILRVQHAILLLRSKLCPLQILDWLQDIQYLNMNSEMT